MELALKIDVDTYQGIAEGASRLAAYLHAEHIPASFFVTMGPDTSGQAAWRVFRHPGFLKKMKRTSAIAVYGWRTVLSGTLWPARPMAVSFADRLRQWRTWGFEVSPHGYDHIRWHNQAVTWDEARARRELEKITGIYQHIFSDSPQSFAAPGWQAGMGTWQAMEPLRLLYHSDSRGDHPYFVQAAGRTLKTLEIPTTLPTWDEMLAWDDITPDNLVDRTWALFRSDRLNVWTLHAEFEGTDYFDRFRRVVERAKQEKVQWVFLPQVAERLMARPGQPPVCDFTQGTRPGRAGTVTCQRLNG